MTVKNTKKKINGRDKLKKKVEQCIQRQKNIFAKNFDCIPKKKIGPYKIKVEKS